MWNRLLLANIENLAEGKWLVKIWKNTCKWFLQIRIRNLWCVRDLLCNIFCPTSPSKQSCGQHEVMPALALSPSFWRPPGYSFYHLFGQPIPLLHSLPLGKKSEAILNLRSCNFSFDPCSSLCCWEEFGSMIDVVPRADSHSSCIHSSNPQDLFSMAAVCSQSVLMCGVILAQVCNFLLLMGTLFWAQSSGLSRFLWIEALPCGISISPFPSLILALYLL